MAAQAKHREAIVKAAADLFRRQGYAATGTNQIVAESGAPKGSLYHYFPGGKASIAASALAHSGRVVQGTLAALAARQGRPGELVRAYGALLAGWMSKSAFRYGCPLTTALLELAPAERGVAEAGRAAFAGWAGIFAAALTAENVDPERARRLSCVAIAAFEGALILARTESETGLIDEIAEEIALLFESAVREPKSGPSIAALSANRARKEHPMPRGDTSKYTAKQERKAEHIEEGYRKRGVGKKEAESRAWAAVNKDDGGGKNPGGSGRGKETGNPAAHKGGRKGGAAAASRSAAARSASAKKGAATRKRNAARDSASRSAAAKKAAATRKRRAG